MRDFGHGHDNQPSQTKLHSESAAALISDEPI
jgi:hypothetical protein